MESVDGFTDIGRTRPTMFTLYLIHYSTPAFHRKIFLIRKHCLDSFTSAKNDIKINKTIKSTNEFFQTSPDDSGQRTKI